MSKLLPDTGGLHGLLRRSSDILLAVSGLGLLLMTFIIGWQVFGRYVLGSSPDYSEQAALALMIWFSCLAAAAGVREGFHIRIAALENVLPGKARFILQCAQQLVVAISGLAMLIYGTQLVMGTWHHVIPTLGLPRGLAYLCIPIAGLLIIFFCLEHLYILLRKREPEPIISITEDPSWN